MTAGILALVISSAICLVYYNPGIHITNETGATDYVWRSSRFASTMIEGIAWNHTDKNGFYNESSIDKNMNVLVMGSSQMEGTNVFPYQKASWLLEELTDKTVYNIGISGHNLLICAKNLETALMVYAPTEYVIIETGTTMFSEKAINKCLSGNMDNLPSYDSGILFHLQKIPYLKLMYSQIWAATDDIEKEYAPVSETAYDQLIQKIKKTCDAYNVTPVIFFHPHLNIDGSVAEKEEEVSLPAFQSACEAHDVIFVDMTEDFMNMYHDNYVLPHGFCNTAVGIGHLNRFGHEAIAKRLAGILSNNFNVTEEE